MVSSLSSRSPSNSLRMMVFSGWFLTFSSLRSTTITFLKSLLRYLKSFINYPFFQTIASLPNTFLICICLGSIFWILLIRVNSSSSANITISYFWDNRFNIFYIPGRIVVFTPFPNMYSDFITVPDMFRIRVFGCKSGCTTSGSSFLDVGWVMNWVRKVYFYHIVHIVHNSLGNVDYNWYCTRFVFYWGLFMMIIDKIDVIW